MTTRAVVLAGAVLVALLAAALPASAHNVLISSDPVDGSTVQTAPTSVSLTFDLPIQNLDPQLVVTGPNGNDFASAAPTIDSNVISVPLGPLGAAGVYQIAYRIVSADGHPVTGQLSFTLAAAAAGTGVGSPPAAGNTPANGGESSGFGPWLWLGIGVAAVIVVVAVVFAVRRPRSAAPPAPPGAAPSGPSSSESPPTPESPSTPPAASGE